MREEAAKEFILNNIIVSKSDCTVQEIEITDMQNKTLQKLDSSEIRIFNDLLNDRFEMHDLRNALFFPIEIEQETLPF